MNRGTLPRGERVAAEQRGYQVRDAGAEHPWKTYPYSLRALIEALEDARFKSYSGPPQLLVVTEGEGERVIRRFEDGREVAV